MTDSVARDDATLSVAAAVELLKHPDGWLRASPVTERFGSLFGRDSLVSALQLLPSDPSIAHATLEYLGSALGGTADKWTEQEPGKVLHEARDDGLESYLAHGWPVRDGRLRYYGSVDASAWFLIVLGALARHGGAIGAHRRSAERVADWIASKPAPLSYSRSNPIAGLSHQGWRDVAWDLEGQGHGPVSLDGGGLRAPVALAQVSALTWRALSEATLFVDRRFGDAASRALGAFGRTFLSGESTWPAFALHAGGLDGSVTSDLGQILWTGVLDSWPTSALATMRRVSAPDLATPHGIRTVASGHPAFRVDGYHVGAVWPFDSWLAAGGIEDWAPGSREGLWEGIRSAMQMVGGYPECYGVDEAGELVRVAEACHVQAWTVGAAAAMEAGWDGRAWKR